MSLQFESFQDFKSFYAVKMDETFNAFLAEPQTARFQMLSKMARYQWETGGKRLRACLPGWFFHAAGRDPQSALHLGLAVELLHNATLAHDDLQDGDELRRGVPTVWKAFDGNQAINCGDALFYFANMALMKFETSTEIREKLFSHFTQCMLQVIEGQAQEFLLKEESFPSAHRYKEMVQGKTSGLFEMPILSSLIALNQSEPVLQAAKQASALLGVLFQIQDDVLDIYGQKGRDKKASDVFEGKISYLAAHVFEQGSSTQKAVLNEVLRKTRQQTTAADIELVLEIFTQTKAKQAALSEIERLKTEIQNGCDDMGPYFRKVFDSLLEVVLAPIQGI